VANYLINSVHKSDVTRDDSQRRFLAQHIVAMLQQEPIMALGCNDAATIQNNMTTMLQSCIVLKIVVANCPL